MSPNLKSSLSAQKIPNEAMPGSSRIEHNPSDHSVADISLGSARPIFKDAPLTKIPLAAMVPMTLSLYEGVLKYGHYSQYTVKPDLYVNAALRHLAKFSAGMDREPDTQYHPLGAVMSSCGIILNAIHDDLYVESRPRLLHALDTQKKSMVTIEASLAALLPEQSTDESLQALLCGKRPVMDRMTTRLSNQTTLNKRQKLAQADPKDSASNTKLPLSLISLSMKVPLAHALQSICNELGELMGFWRHKNIDLQFYLDGIESLLSEFNEGSNLYRDGLPILAHVMAKCAIVIDAQDCGKVNDNRLKDVALVSENHSFELLEKARETMAHLQQQLSKKV